MNARARSSRKPSDYATWAALIACGAGLVGCEHGERDPYSANDVAAATAFHARQRAAAMRDSKGDARTDAASAKVRCRCDADGGLHVHAPAGAKVTVPETASEEEADAEAEIEVEVGPRPGTRIRNTVSLGFVGDAPLTQVPSRGGPWNVPDALLPIHSHGGGGTGYITTGYVAYGGGYRGGSGVRSGYPGYGPGYTGGGFGRSGGSSRGGGGGSGGGGVSSGPSHNLHYAPHTPTSGGSFGGVGGGGGGRPAGGGRGPR